MSQPADHPATTTPPATDTRDRLFEALARARLAPPEDLAAALRALPEVGELPSPWATWTFFELVRYRRRQQWARDLIRDALPDLPDRARERSGDEPIEGDVPGAPAWRFEIEEDYGFCGLTDRVTGELIELDLEAGPGQESYFRFVRLLDFWESRDPIGPFERFRQLHPIINTLYLASQELKELALLEDVVLNEDYHYVVERLAPIAPAEIEDAEAFVAALGDTGDRLWLAALVGDWLAAAEAAEAIGAPELIAITRQRADHCLRLRLDRLRPSLESGKWTLFTLGALQQVDAKEFETYARRALEAGGLKSLAALNVLRRTDDPSNCPGVERLFRSLHGSPERLDELIRCECARVLARHQLPTEETIEAIAEFGQHLDEAILLALEHSPTLAMPLIRRGIRSADGDEGLSAAAILALIDRPWAVRELLSALASSADPDRTPWCREALRRSSDPQARANVAAWEDAHLAGEAPDEVGYLEDDMDPVERFGSELERLRGRVALLRDRTPLAA